MMMVRFMFENIMEKGIIKFTGPREKFGTDNEGILLRVEISSKIYTLLHHLHLVGVNRVELLNPHNLSFHPN